MPKIVVAGCSFSDRTGVPKSYGDYLAELIGYEYLHLARGGSSNNRAFYILSKNIIDGKITSDDVVIHQYTDTNRTFFGSLPENISNCPGYDPLLPGQIEIHKTPFGDAYTSDFKTNSYVYIGGIGNKLLHKVYEDYGAVCDSFEKDKWISDVNMFIALCEKYNIKIVPLKCRLFTYWENSVGCSPEEFLPEYAKQYLFKESDYIEIGSVEHPRSTDFGITNNSVYDHSHLSTEGHLVLANALEKHLKDKYSI